MNTPTLFINAPVHHFLLPYFEREFADHTVVDEAPATKIDVAIMISSTDIYKLNECIDEATEINLESVWVRREEAFRTLCAQKGVNPCILRVPHIVATGMSGLPMRLARGIARGTLMHIKGNEAIISLIHGIDVAQYARALMGKDVTVNITDGTNTSVDLLIDALARRINDKKVFTLSPRWARLLYGKDFYEQLTTSLRVNDAKARKLAPEVNLHPVTDYLTTHIYDDESL